MKIFKGLVVGLVVFGLNTMVFSVEETKTLKDKTIKGAGTIEKNVSLVSIPLELGASLSQLKEFNQRAPSLVENIKKLSTVSTLINVDLLNPTPLQISKTKGMVDALEDGIKNIDKVNLKLKKNLLLKIKF
jgi:hypothetical protein